MVSKLEKAAKLERLKLGKKAVKKYNDEQRGAAMPRPTVFSDKRFRVKHKKSIEEDS